MSRFAFSALLVGTTLAGAWQGIQWNRQHLAAVEKWNRPQQLTAEWIQRNVLPEEPIAGLGWFVPWDLAFLAERVPSSVDPEAPTLTGLSRWLVITPEAKIFGQYNRGVQEFLSKHARLVAEYGWYEIYGVQEARETDSHSQFDGPGSSDGPPSITSCEARPTYFLGASS